ncbi:hypothetical protein AVEN_198394-1 [Araneus ventricosus]|uniref:Uncharacterized protein n=1 Tax=Araneus ventricosus TaxID=182803 RepID=A0A4Y2FM56_ARAVE|nr:hypothetical protein AVEN_198394-1 [Araneus ventricosus]
MDIPNLVACIAVTPWFWIMMKFILVGDLYDIIPLAFFGYLLVLLNRAIRQDRFDLMKALKDNQHGQKDGYCQTDELKSEDKGTQSEQETNEAYTQASTQCFEISTQTVLIQSDACTQVERKEFHAKYTQTVSEIMNDKQVQTLLQGSDKETQTSPHLCLDKEVQTLISGNPSKVFVPVKKQKPKTTIPLTKEFLKYHQNKHTLQRRKIKFNPKLDKISEVDENENGTEISEVPSYDGLESQVSTVDKKLTAQNNHENSFFHEIDEDEKETDLGKLSSHVELEFQASAVSKTLIAPNSVLQHGDSSKDGHHVIVQDGKKHRKEQKKASFFKKKFSNLKKLFKK